MSIKFIPTQLARTIRISSCSYSSLSHSIQRRNYFNSYCTANVSTSGRRCIASEISDNSQERSKVTESLNTNAPSAVNNQQLTNDLVQKYVKYPNLSKYLQTQLDFNKTAECVATDKSDDNDDLLLLLQCCGTAYPHRSPKVRAEICEQIWKNLKLDNPRLKVQHYNVYLKLCLENGTKVEFKQFIKEMSCKPDCETYKLLLEIACENGEVDQAFDLLLVMKNDGIPVDERIFNCLILCDTTHGGLADGKEVIRTMKAAHIPETDLTHWSLLKGLARRKNKNEFKDFLSNTSLAFDKNNFFNIISSFVKFGNDWLDLLKKALHLEELPRENILELENICIGLIHENRPKTAIDFYCQLVPASHSSEYGVFLLKEMLKTGQPTEAILDAVKTLKEKGFNDLALENVTEIALRKEYFTVASQLLENFEVLRPHYFWPLLCSCKSKGEIELLNVLNKMIQLGVHPDEETIESYFLNFCYLSNPEELVLKLQKLGLTRKQLLPSFIITFLAKGLVSEAYKISCDKDVSISNELVFVFLAKAWLLSNDLKHTILLLQKLYESTNKNIDSVGIFLAYSFKIAGRAREYDKFLKLITEVNNISLRMSNASSDELFKQLHFARNYKYLPELERMVEKVTDIALRENKSYITHPKDMNINDLEHHLTELTSKGLETRGVIRKLIQEHCKLRNYERIQELRSLFIKSGYEETPGMISSLLYSYVVNGDLKMARETYAEMKSLHPNFLLDEYKVLDFAALMVKQNNFGDAVDLIEQESSNRVVRNAKGIERNCRILLDANKCPSEAKQLFDLLIRYGYCSPNNVIFGPLVRSHLKNNDVEMAVKIFGEFAAKYHCTPLQLELLKEVLKKQNERLLGDVLQISSKIHGAASAKSTLVSALAENGMHGPLRKLLINNGGLPSSFLEDRYERWVKEEKLGALETLLKSSQGLSVLDVDSIFFAIIRIYSIRNDCVGAENFWKGLQERDVVIPKQLEKEYSNLMKRCNYKYESTDSVTVHNR